MNNLRSRAFKALNLEQLFYKNDAEKVAKVSSEEMLIPSERQYILRMLVSRDGNFFKLPDELGWVSTLLTKAISYQKSIGITQPFCYITVRHGLVESEKDDEWHLDGFSMKITHLPEQNYIWSNVKPTEVVVKALDIPMDFYPMVHNIHQFIQDRITVEDEIKTLEPETLYGLDTYVIHRRPQLTEPIWRTFVRISFTPIEINDVNNTQNPFMPTNYTNDGVAFRNTLKRY